MRLLTKLLMKGGGAVSPLRFASPQNYVQTGGVVAASTTYLNVRTRMPFYVGSGDLSQIVLAFCGFNLNGGNINFNGNDYTIVKCAIERDGVAAYTPVYFGGSRSVTVTNGIAEVLSDAVLPAAFSLANFARGTKLWIRLEYSVASTGQQLPVGPLPYSQWTGAVGLTLTSGAVVDPVDGTGTMTFTSGFSNFSSPYVPMVLGRFVSGDQKTIIGIGDSIIYGASDTLSGYGLRSGFTQALVDADHVSNPIAGANFGYSGSTAALWTGANSDRLVNYLKYAKYAVDEYQTNRLAANGNLASAKTQVESLWALCATAGITQVLRQKLNPRSTGTDGTLPYSTSFASGGDARLFNDWLDTGGLGTAQGVTLTILQMNALRAGTNQATDAFYQWSGATSGNLGTLTGDGTHPNTAGNAAQAADFRTAFAALP